MKFSRVLLLFLIYIIKPIYANDFDFPRYLPTATVEYLGSVEEPLPVEDLIVGALHLSGVESGGMVSYIELFTDILQLLDHNIDQDKESPKETGEAILRVLHDQVFTGYSEPQTKVDTVLRKEKYNYVSSAVVYLIAARAMDLEVKGVETVDHAFCRVAVNGSYIDVETTNPYGFNPGEKKEFENAFGQTGFSYVAPGEYTDRIDIGEKELLSLILQNRISMLQEEHQFFQSVGLAVDRYYLTNTAEAYQDMVMEFSNFCSRLNDQKQYQKALSFLDLVRQLYGNDPYFAEVSGPVVYNAVSTKINERKFSEARDLLEDRRDRGDISSEDAAELMKTVDEGELYYSLDSFPFAQGIGAVEQAYDRGSITSARREEFLIYLYSSEADEYARQGDYLKAAGIVEEGIASGLQDRSFTDLRDTFLYNYTATVHNSFVEWYNSGDSGQALAVLEEGLANVPDSPLLLKDKSLLNQ